MDKLGRVSSVWLTLAILAALLGAPNGVIVKAGLGDVSPMMYTSMRFVFMALVLAPYLYSVRNKFNKKNINYAIYVAIATAVSTTAYIYAIGLGSVSYISLINLITPIIFIIFSLMFVRERVNQQSIFGITLAAIGAFLLIIYPVMTGDRSITDTPIEAIILAAIDAVIYPFIVIFARKADENGLPIMASLGFSAASTAVVTFIAAMIFYSPTQNFGGWSIDFLVSALYSSIAVALVSRWLVVETYEHLGSFVIASLSYTQYFLAVLLPMIILGENITGLALAAGAMVLTGVIITEKYHNHKNYLNHHLIHHR